MDVRALSKDMLKLVRAAMRGVAFELCREVSNCENVEVEELSTGVMAFCKNIEVFVMLERKEESVSFGIRSPDAITLTVSLKATIRSIEDESAQLIKVFVGSSSQ